MREATPSDDPPALVIARGARVAEAQLVAALLAAAPREPHDLGRPLRVVVPSRSLREHLCALLARGRALAGVAVQTLHGLAFEILERAGEAVPVSASLVPVLVRQRARREPELQARLEDLDDGYAVVEAAVSDLLDAGFEAAHADGLCELLTEVGDGALSRRAAEVIAVARDVALAVEGGRVGHRASLYRRARERLERAPGAALPARGLLVHGFADATGVQTDLIEALMRCCGARVFLDRPPDPVEPEGATPASDFGARFAERLGGVAAAVSRCEERRDPARIAVRHAPGAEAEVRSAADDLRARLDAGACPERLAIVARDLGAHRLALRRQLERLGIPFSGCGEVGPRSPAGRRLDALLALLRDAERAPAERWLEALGGLRAFGRDRVLAASARADAGMALHVLGAARLGEVAALEPTRRLSDGKGVALPARVGLETDDEGAVVARRRWLARPQLDALVAAARALCERLAQRGAECSLAQRLAWLRGLVERDLGWWPGLEGAPELADAVFAPGAGLPGDFALSHGDFALWLQRCLADALRVPVGGRGGGVQVLDAMEARARSFDAVFALGLNRDVFPRVITEDPLLPDSLRRRLRALLPDLPVKGEGFDEERHLFAQLVSSADHVVLSCAITDDDGKPRPASPLLEAFRLADRVGEPERVAGPYTAASLARDPRPPRPALEHAQLAGLFGARSDFAERLALALDEVLPGPAPADGWRALARARLAVLSELDPRAGRRAALGPYDGFVGAPRERADPRRGALPVTTAERAAACPWQAFLERLLRLEPPPDALGALPGFEPRVLGTLVHGVLEQIVAAATGDGGGELAAIAARAPRPVPWPTPQALAGLARERAAAVVRDEGISIAGFAELLAGHAIARLELARVLDWPEPGSEIGALGVEVSGELRLPGAGPPIRFRADRVDRAPAGLRLVDYKTGRPFARQQSEGRRRARHLERVGLGLNLQAAAYARAAAEAGCASAEGRYLFLHPDAPEHARRLEVSADDGAFAERLTAALGAVAEAWQRGSFFPRLEERATEQEPRRCTTCAVKMACLRGDSGARARIVDWVSAHEPRAGRLAPAERALLAVWHLGAEDA